LTSLPRSETFPALSADGNQVAFSWDGEKGDNRDIGGGAEHSVLIHGRPVNGCNR